MKKVTMSFSIAVILAVLVGFGVWFWTLGNVTPEVSAKVQVQGIQGTVEVKKKDATDFRNVNADTEVGTGDEVRTGAGSSAEIRWGDRGVTRLDEQSDLVIDSAPQGTATKTVISLRLASGRAWTRLLKLLDLDISAEMHTDTVVATVRGTAVGLAKFGKGTHVSVSDSVVGVGSPDSSSTSLIREGREGDFSASGTPDTIKDQSGDDQWSLKNQQDDQAFDQDLRDAIQKRFKKRIPLAPEWLTDLSENLHLRLAGDGKRDLELAYLRRAIARSALRLNGLADRLKRGIPDDIDAASRDGALWDLRLSLFLDAPRKGGTVPSVYWDLQKLREKLLSMSVLEQLYAQLLNIDDQIDAFLLTDRPLSERIRLRGLIDDVGSHIPTDGDPRLVKLLRDKIGAEIERLREGGGGGSLTAFAPDVSATGTDEVPTTTPPNAPTSPSTGGNGGTPPPTTPPSTNTPPPTTPPPTTQPVPCSYVRLTMLAVPSTNVNVGDHVSLSLFASCADGTTDNVTPNGSFSIANTADGYISGSGFTPARGGSITINGAYASLNASAVVSVNRTAPKGRQPQRITVTALGPTALTTGQSSPLQATVLYSDQTTADITYQCQWSTSDPKLGMVSNQRFQSLSGTGTDAAICDYSEAGISLQGSVTFTITLDPQLTPTGGGGGLRSTIFDVNGG